MIRDQLTPNNTLLHYAMHLVSETPKLQRGALRNFTLHVLLGDIGIQKTITAWHQGQDLCSHSMTAQQRGPEAM